MFQPAAKPVYDSSALKLPFIYTLVEIVQYRHLIRLLVSRDLKVRYKRSVIGFGWVMLNPLLMMGILAFVFGNLFSSSQRHVAGYILSGILLWTLFAQGTVAAMASLQANSGIIRRVYVPSAVFVLSAVLSALTNLAYSALPFIIITMVDGLVPTWRWIYLLIPILELTMFTAGIGLIIAVLGVFFADTLEIYQVVLQLFFFLTPVMYPINILPPLALASQQVNPMFYILTDFRTVVLEQRFPALRLTLGGLAFSGLILLIGWAIFSSTKDRFAYRL